MLKSNIQTIRRQIDIRLNEAHLKDTADALQKPKEGWIKFVRKILCMTTVQLARRLKISQPAVYKIEKNEALGHITLNTMEKVAESLECKLVYFLVPKNKSFTAIYENQALNYAKKTANIISHSMKLEEQGISEKEHNDQVLEIYREYLVKNSNKVWEE